MGKLRTEVVFGSNKNSEIAKKFMELGGIYYRLNRYEEAVKFYRLAEDTFEFHSNYAIAMILNSECSKARYGSEIEYASAKAIKSYKGEDSRRYHKICEVFLDIVKFMAKNSGQSVKEHIEWCYNEWRERETCDQYADALNHVYGTGDAYYRVWSAYSDAINELKDGGQQ